MNAQTNSAGISVLKGGEEVKAAEIAGAAATSDEPPIRPAAGELVGP